MCCSIGRALRHSIPCSPPWCSEGAGIEVFLCPLDEYEVQTIFWSSISLGFSSWPPLEMTVIIREETVQGQKELLGSSVCFRSSLSFSPFKLFVPRAAVRVLSCSDKQNVPPWRSGSVLSPPHGPVYSEVNLLPHWRSRSTFCWAVVFQVSLNRKTYWNLK